MALTNRCKRYFRYLLIASVLTVVCAWFVKVVFLAIYLLFGHYNVWIGDSGCGELWLSHYLRRMCSNYTESVVYGGLCETICYDADIVVNNCLVHHEETTVVDVTLNNKNMIFKVKDVTDEVDFEIMEQLNNIWHLFIKEREFPTSLLHQFIIDHFQRYLGKDIYDISAERQTKIVQIVLPEQSRQLSEAQLKSIYSYLRVDGILPLIYYQHIRHIPTYFGNCGHLNAVEKLTPFSSLFPAIYSPLTWTKRAVLAVSFLDFMFALQVALDGPLQICDFKESDFGFTGSYEIKLIDLGMLFTEKRTKELISQGSCEDDKGCEFFDCKSTCDRKIRLCSSAMRTNNVQMLCKKIFRQSWPLKGLLNDIPLRIRTPLVTMIDKCSSDAFGLLRSNSSEVKELILDMRNLIASDIEGR